MTASSCLSWCGSISAGWSSSWAPGAGLWSGLQSLWEDTGSGTTLADSLFYVLPTQAVGEPPLFLASSIFFAIKDAIRAARTQHGGDNAKQLFQLDSPATPEKIRNACVDQFTTLVRYFAKLPFTQGRTGDDWQTCREGSTGLSHPGSLGLRTAFTEPSGTPSWPCKRIMNTRFEVAACRWAALAAGGLRGVRTVHRFHFQLAAGDGYIS